VNGRVFLGEFGRRWIKTATVTGSGGVGTIEAFPAYTGTQVMDMEFGPDGALYVLDYGTGWGSGDASSAVHRIEYSSGGGRSPVAIAAANPTSGNAPLTVQFSSAGTSDPDGDPITYAWDFTTNGSTDSTAANPSFTYTSNGDFTATLTVRDSTGRSSTASVVIGVGRPTVTLNQPLNGRLFNFGDAIPYQVTVTDPNAATIDCSRVKINYILGHDSHGHGISSATGCSGTLQTTVDGEHDANANIFGVMVAEYLPAGATIPVTSSQVVMQPRTRQAEHYSGQQGTTIVEKPSANGGTAVGFIENGDWISFTPYNLSGATSFTARVASAGSGGTLTLRTGSATGPVVGTASVSPTGNWETWTNVTGTLTAPTGTQNLFLVFTGGSGYLFDVDAFTFVGGTTPTTPPPTTPPPTTPPPTTPPPTTPPPTTPPPTTPPPTTPAGRSCTAAYTVTSQWSGGFQGEVRVTAGSTAISGWTVTWTMGSGQTVSQSWNATVTTSGSNVTARNVSYNGSLGASASTAFGFIGSGTGANSVSSLSCTAT
jgi:cytochrome c